MLENMNRYLSTSLNIIEYREILWSIRLIRGNEHNNNKQPHHHALTQQAQYWTLVNTIQRKQWGEHKYQCIVVAINKYWQI